MIYLLAVGVMLATVLFFKGGKKHPLRMFYLFLIAFGMLTLGMVGMASVKKAPVKQSCCPGHSH